MTESPDSEAQNTEPFESKLSRGRDRFLAHVIEHSLEVRLRSAADFIRHFPPSAIMEGLRDRPSLRANILVTATGVKTKIALKKDAQSAGRDLQIALDEGESDAETVIGLFDPDDRVRYLEAHALWSFATESKFWLLQDDQSDESERAKEHVAFILKRALVDQLVTHQDIVDGITVHKLATLLPREELEKIIQATLDAARSGRSFADSDLLRVTPGDALVGYIPLSLLWEQVVVPRIAKAHGFEKDDKLPAEETNHGVSIKDLSERRLGGDVRGSARGDPKTEKHATSSATVPALEEPVHEVALADVDLQELEESEHTNPALLIGAFGDGEARAGRKKA